VADARVVDQNMERAVLVSNRGCYSDEMSTLTICCACLRHALSIAAIEIPQ